MLRVLIQVAAGACEKHVYDERTLAYRETQQVSLPYPYPYGFVIGTIAADGDCIDCYVITSARLKPGTIVECEPFGLLLQDEGGEADHKILAAMPGEEVAAGRELLQELRGFISAMFAEFPDASVRVGPILPREAALHHLRESRLGDGRQQQAAAPSPDPAKLPPD